MASAQNSESWYVSLLGLAESFRTSNPPNIRLCIHCLQSIFNLKPPPRIEARTHLQLGNIFLTHTKNMDLAQQHLEKAWTVSSSISQSDSRDVHYESASVLAQLYEKQTERLFLEFYHWNDLLGCPMSQVQLAKPLLRKAIEISQQAPYWRCRLLFQLAQIHASERDLVSAVSLLSHGADFAHSAQSHYTRLLFLLSKGMAAVFCARWRRCNCDDDMPVRRELQLSSLDVMVDTHLLLSKGMLLLVDKKMAEVHETLSQTGALTETFDGSPIQKESLKVFFLVLQVCHYLMAGQVKSVKSVLKQLQQSIQTITQLHSDDEPLSSNPVDLLQWMPKEHMCVLVYLVTVMHAMQAGYMDKAQKYTDKALLQIEKLKLLDSHPLLSAFQLMLLEHIIMCRLIMGNKTVAIQEDKRRLFLKIDTAMTGRITEPVIHVVKIFQACHVCQQQPRLFTTHGSQIHTLLGLYAMSMNCMEAAEAQFNTASRLSTDTSLWTFINLNLAIVYLRTNRQTELVGLLERVDPERLPSHSHSLKASAYYVRGLQAFFQARYTEAKRFLRETLKMANEEDLNRLTSCSLVLLGHIFLSLGNNTEAMNMVTPAMQLAGKIPDVHVQLWASALLKDLYRLCNDPVNEAEGYRMHNIFSQSLLKDHFQSSKMSEHGLVQWVDGPCPFHLSSSSAGASSAML